MASTTQTDSGRLRGSASRPAGLCFVGPLAGARPGYVVTQGVRLSVHFRDAGYPVIAVSESPNRYVRLLDIAWTVLRRARRIDILVVHVYGGPRLFWMRSFHRVYNPLMAIRVLERLRASHPEATLVMGGQDKGMQAETRGLAASLGLSDRVRFPGFLDTEAKAREGKAADIFINTSHVDNMPVAVIEAGALGLPVVSTTVGGIADLLTEGETALLTPDDDVEAMAGAVRRLLADPDLSARLSANGRQLAERSAWERVRGLWEELFSEVLSGPDHGKREAV